MAYDVYTGSAGLEDLAGQGIPVILKKREEIAAGFIYHANRHYVAVTSSHEIEDGQRRRAELLLHKFDKLMVSYMFCEGCIFIPRKQIIGFMPLEFYAWQKVSTGGIFNPEPYNGSDSPSILFCTSESGDCGFNTVSFGYLEIEGTTPHVLRLSSNRIVKVSVPLVNEISRLTDNEPISAVYDTGMNLEDLTNSFNRSLQSYE